MASAACLGGDVLLSGTFSSVVMSFLLRADDLYLLFFC